MKYLFASLLCLFSYICHSQVYRLRAFSTHVAILNDNGDEISKPDLWVESETVVVINMDKYKIHTYGQKETDIDLTDKIETRDEKDKISFDYTGVDEDGEKCRITVVVYKTGQKHVATLIVMHINMKMAVIYRLQKDI